jgi:TRAP-type C4-dicarboxylate transport system substrate-binding protein
MNLDRWNSLPDDIKQAFTDASGEDWLAELGEIWRKNDDDVIEAFVAAGNTHVVLTEEETAAFDAALAPVVDRWVADVTAQGIDGAGLVERARAAIAAHSGGS